MLSVRALLLILAASAVAGCGDDYASATTPATTAASTESDVTAPEKTVPTCVADSTERIGSNRETYAAVVAGACAGVSHAGREAARVVRAEERQRRPDRLRRAAPSASMPTARRGGTACNSR